MEAQLISLPIFALRGRTHLCGETDETQTDKEEQSNGGEAGDKYYGEDQSRGRYRVLFHQRGREDLVWRGGILGWKDSPSFGFHRAPLVVVMYPISLSYRTITGSLVQKPWV